MSKERLEEIVKQVKRSDEYAEKGLWTASDKKIVNLHNEGHINYLIERVQELESELNKQIEIGYKFEGEAYDLAKENKRYREAINNIIEKVMLFGTNEEVYEAIQYAIKALEGEE